MGQDYGRNRIIPPSSVATASDSPMHVPFELVGASCREGDSNPAFTIRHPVNSIHPVSKIDWTGLREEQALSLLPASPAPRHFPSSFPFVRLERRVKMAYANPSFTIRNPVNPVHPVSNIDWTGLREEQDYPSFQRRHRLGFPHACPVRAFGMAGKDGACQPVLYHPTSR